MKTRLDFVSNSSTCSYVIYSKLDAKTLGKKMWELSGVPEEGIKKWSKIFSEYLSDHTILILYDISFDVHLTKTQLKEFYPGESTSNQVFRGCCCSDEDLSNYFTPDGKVREDLNVDDIIRMYGWYHFDGKKIIFGQDESDGCHFGSGKINEYTVEFMRWLFKALSEKYSNVRFSTDGDTSTSALDDLEREIYESEFNHYWIKVNYEGDGYPCDGVYYNSKVYKDVGYLDTLQKNGICGDCIWAENG